MLSQRPRWTVSLLALAVCCLPAWALAAAPGAALAGERFAGTWLTLVPQADFKRAVLRIAGPDGYALSRELSADSALEVDLLTAGEPLARDGSVPELQTAGAHRLALADGKYRYELVLIDAAGQRQVQRGSFSVAGGIPVSRATPQPKVLGDEAGAAEPGDRPRQATAHSHSVTGDFDDFVSIRNQTGTGISRLNLNTSDSLTVDSESWRLTNDADINTFNIVEGNATTRLTMVQGGNIGLGTTVPLSPLHIVRTGGFQLRLEGSGADYRFDAFGTSLRIGNASNTNQFRIFQDAPFNSLVVQAAGVGVGTAAPEAKLHVLNGSVRVEQQPAGAPAVRELFRLANDGGPFFIFNDTSLAKSWAFASLANNDFAINQQQNPGIEYRFDGVGNLAIAGALTQSSSRQTKDGITSVDPAAVLAKVLELPIAEWSYKHDAPRVRHMGPMAEDFWQAFGLGLRPDGISTIDTAGVSFAAIQGLHEVVAQVVEQKDARIQQLEQRLAELERIVQALAEPQPPQSP